MRYVIRYPNKDGEDVEEVFTENDILDEYWEYWQCKMSDKYGINHPLITFDNCIADWVSDNLAEKIEEESDCRIELYTTG